MKTVISEKEIRAIAASPHFKFEFVKGGADFVNRNNWTIDRDMDELKFILKVCYQRVYTCAYDIMENDYDYSEQVKKTIQFYAGMIVMFGMAFNRWEGEKDQFSTYASINKINQGEFTPEVAVKILKDEILIGNLIKAVDEGFASALTGKMSKQKFAFEEDEEEAA